MYKNRMWNQIKDNTDTTDDIRCILMVSLRTKWKEAKHEAKTSRYDPYDTDIERLAHSLVNVEEYQWRSLVHYWSSEDAKVIMVWRLWYYLLFIALVASKSIL
ncbi:hypothetical protein FXO37_35233 [Capsicum annuum]|nr:hypothetical protein FXO37_35233 [Capsicum annuum]